jgi:hypothetical protein
MTEGERSIGIGDILLAFYDYAHDLGSSFNMAGNQWDKLDEDGKRVIGDQLTGEIESRKKYIDTVGHLLEQLSEYGIEGDIPPEVLTMLGLEVHTAPYRTVEVVTEDIVDSSTEVGEKKKLRDITKDRADTLRVVWQILGNGEKAESEREALGLWYKDQLEAKTKLTQLPREKVVSNFLKQKTNSVSRRNLRVRVEQFFDHYGFELNQQIPLALPVTDKFATFFNVLSDLNEVEAYDGVTMGEMLDMIYQPRSTGRGKK